ncbi:MAG: hypothetical protein LAT55_12720 [Opitutales bacterium]|nr:hypothetical protein [Opitutales bacterium]
MERKEALGLEGKNFPQKIKNPSEDPTDSPKGLKQSLAESFLYENPKGSTEIYKIP